MKRIGLVVVFSLGITIAIAAYFLTKTDFVYRESFVSPNNVYTVDLFVQKKMSPQLSMTGDSAHKKAFIVLKNSQGKVLAQPSLFNPCRFVMDEFYLSWEEDGRLYFTKFNYIDLSSMSMNCM